MKKTKLLLYAVVFLFLSPQLSASDSVTVIWRIRDCKTYQALHGALVSIRVWDPDLAGGRYFTKELKSTSATGQTACELPAKHLDRRVRYDVQKDGYPMLSGEFLLQTNLQIDTCLETIGEIKKEEPQPQGVTLAGIVKNHKAESVEEAIITLEIDSASQGRLQLFSDSTGNFSWSFDPSFLGHRLEWKASKQGYSESTGDFLIDKHKSLYISLSPVISPPKKKKDTLNDFIRFGIPFAVWSAALIHKAFLEK